MADPFVGEIRINSFNFAPKGWATCDGQVMQIQQNAALYSLLGVYYGGDGKATFQLPDLRGRTPIGYGVSSTHTTYNMGNKGGAETVSLAANQIPRHQHEWNAVTAAANKALPTSFLYATSPAPIKIYSAPSPASSATTISPKTIASTGGGAGHNNMQPFLAVNFCIALVGYYPPRQ